MRQLTLIAEIDECADPRFFAINMRQAHPN